MDWFDWLQLKLTIQGTPPRLGDANWASNLEFLLLYSRFWVFTIYRDFIWISFDFLFFYSGKKVGSSSLGTVFVHQNVSARFGSCAPTLNEEDGSTAGPIRQIKWDTKSLFSFCVSFGTDRLHFTSISTVFSTEFEGSPLCACQGSPFSIAFCSPLHLPHADTWLGCCCLESYPHLIPSWVHFASGICYSSSLHKLNI